jgi:hypothetical protein
MGEGNQGGQAEVVVAADIGSRWLSYIADIVLFSVLAFVALLVLSVAHGPVVTVQRAGNLVDRVHVDPSRFTIDTLVITALSAAYFACSWCRWGATAGQRLSRIGVRPADRAFDPDARPSLGRATARWIGLGMPLWVAAGVTVGMLRWALWAFGWVWYGVLAVTSARSRSGQGVHDRMAGTVAVRTVRALEPAPPASSPTNLVPMPADA